MNKHKVVSMDSPAATSSHELPVHSGSDSAPEHASEKSHHQLSPPTLDRPDTSIEVDDESQYPATLRLSLILLALFMTTFLGIVATAIPSITNEFHAIDEIGWYGGAYFLTIGVFSSFWGKLYKYYDAKWVFLVAAAIFCIGSLVAAVAPNSTALIVGRAVAGWGGAGIVNGSYIITHHIARPEKRPAFTGLIGAVFIFSSILGPIVGGAFTYEVTWRWCFYINLPVGGVAMILVFFLVRLPKHAGPEDATLREVILQLDFPGIIVMLASLICLTLALQWGGTSRSWSNGSVVACLVVWVLLTIGFVGIQIYQGDRAMIPPRIFSQRTVWVSCVYVFLINGPNFLVIYYLPIYFQAVKGNNAIQSGVNILPAVCLFAFGCLFAGWLIGKVGHWQPFLTMGALLSVAGTALIYELEVDSSMAWYLGSQVLFGFGAGSSSQVPMIAIQAFSKPQDLTSATGVVLFFQLINGGYFISAGQAIFSNQLLHALPTYAPDVDPALVLSTGAGDITNVFAGEALGGVLSSYMVGLKNAFALGLAAAALCVPISMLAPRKKLPSDGGKKGPVMAA
ncbi:MFS gliotoxin efflux transporter glia [Bombardia bombarda]|uniref:MFS gliotoxin efflux transporter glia n=1 Tax=Bombardia bombarda TaxID=252184 RepID=A0AA39X1E5_9PEZI|nr:MFS gliotoxin efflux transporter glia [Bombardia bombarda]